MCSFSPTSVTVETLKEREAWNRTWKGCVSGTALANSKAFLTREGMRIRANFSVFPGKEWMPRPWKMPFSSLLSYRAPRLRCGWELIHSNDFQERKISSWSWLSSGETQRPDRSMQPASGLPAGGVVPRLGCAAPSGESSEGLGSWAYRGHGPETKMLCKQRSKRGRINGAKSLFITSHGASGRFSRSALLVWNPHGHLPEDR